MACSSPLFYMLPFEHNDLPSGCSSGGGLVSMTLYTVEQLELIRRLKATGITVQAIVEAFNEMSTVSSELDSMHSFIAPPPQLPQQQQQPVVLPAVVSSPIVETRQPPISAPATLPGPTLAQVLQQQQQQASAAGLPTHLSSIETTLSSIVPAPLSSPVNSMFLQALQAAPLQLSSAAASSSLLHNSLAAAVAAAQASAAAAAAATQNQQQHSKHLTPTRPSSAAAAATSASTSGESRAQQRTPMREITTLDNPKELEDFMSSGEEKCINDMKTFITHYSLRQTTVAMMTGVSQPYISKLLNGNHRELSLRCRKNIYCWYLNCRKHPEKLSSFLADPSSRLETNTDGELVPQKRERYVFRPVLLRLLEQFFTETPFPDTQRRIEIATSCNAALQQDKRGVGLMPKEVVSPQVVSNWFANKRKELRRKNDPRYQDPINGLHPAIIEALEGGGSAMDQSETGSVTPTDDDSNTMDGLIDPAAATPVSRATLPPPDFRIFEALGLAAPSAALFHHQTTVVKQESLELREEC